MTRLFYLHSGRVYFGVVGVLEGNKVVGSLRFYTFLKKTFLRSFKKVKFLKDYSKIGSWILKPARLAARTV